MSGADTSSGETNAPKELVKIGSDQKSQEINLGGIIQSFLSGANTEVETSRFSIEKTQGGIRVDIAFTGTIKSAKKNTETKNPS
ncbi:MAG: hypothetical protein ACHQ1H_09755 [Nitrososphaerales archaeon]